MSLMLRRTATLLQIHPVIRKEFIFNAMKLLGPIASHNFVHTEKSRFQNQQDSKGSSQLVLHSFSNIKDKSKDTFLDVLRIYVKRDIRRRGHVEFIYAAMKHMEEFGVNKDLEAYKALIDVLPKGKFIPTNFFQAEFQHFPKQQQCAIDVLEQMEDNGVIPDYEMEDMLLNIFGKKGYPLRKFWRMMYWMPKFKNASPWPLPNPVPNDSLELAKLAMQRISTVDLQSKVTVINAEDVENSIDKTWIVSAMSPVQQELLEKHPSNVPIYVEGPFKIWLRTEPIEYFILRADLIAKPEKPALDPDDVASIKLPFWETDTSDVAIPTSVHEQEDGTIFAVCATGTSSRDSLLSWIRHLEAENSVLSKIPVLFTLKSPLGAVIPIEANQSSNNEGVPGENKIEEK